MPTSVDIKNLKINKLTEAQYDTAVQGGVIGENELSVLTDAELEQIQVSALPTASADELGNIYQFIGTTDANYTNGYFYKCTGAGDPVVYSWTQVNVQPAVDPLPSQSGQSGKFLTTDGTNASWATVDALPSQTGMGGKFLQTDGTTASWETAAQVSQPSTMPTLAVADWSLNAQTNKYEQTVNVTGVTASNAVLVAPFPVNATEYAQCNVIAVAQGAGTLSFQADSLPANALGVNVVTLS